MDDKVEIPKIQENLSTCSQHQLTPTNELRMHMAEPLVHFSHRHPKLSQCVEISPS